MLPAGGADPVPAFPKPAVLRSVSLAAVQDADFGELPAIPATVMRISELLADDRSSMSHIAEALETDPGLTANILRIANSPIYRGRVETTLVSAACARLGTATVHELLSSAWLRSSLPESLLFYGEKASDFWQHSVAAAVFAKRLAPRARQAPATAFTGGLLHDVGKLVLARVAARADALALANLKPQPDVRATERVAFGTDHAQVGAQLVHRWSLPHELERALAEHHAPTVEHPLGAVVHVASAMAHGFGFGVAGGLRRVLEPEALRLVGWDQSELGALGRGCLADIRRMTNAVEHAKG